MHRSYVKTSVIDSQVRQGLMMQEDTSYRTVQYCTAQHRV